MSQIEDPKIIDQLKEIKDGPPFVLSICEHFHLDILVYKMSNRIRTKKAETFEYGMSNIVAIIHEDKLTFGVKLQSEREHREVFEVTYGILRSVLSRF